MTEHELNMKENAKELLKDFWNEFWNEVEKADARSWVPPKIDRDEFIKKYNPVDRTITLKPDGKRGKNDN